MDIKNSILRNSFVALSVDQEKIRCNFDPPKRVFDIMPITLLVACFWPIEFQKFFSFSFRLNH